jgi:GNAT superfamily N-acetyltransferase
MEDRASNAIVSISILLLTTFIFGGIKNEMARLGKNAPPKMDTFSLLRFHELTEKNKEAVREIYASSFPDLSLEDLEISWDYRSKADSIGFWYKSKLIGFAIASYHTRSGGSLYIDYFAIHKDHRGKGIGSEIIKGFLSTIQGSVHLFPINEDLAHWYEQNGFKESNKGYYVYHTYPTRNRMR